MSAADDLIRAQIAEAARCAADARRFAAEAGDRAARLEDDAAQSPLPSLRTACTRSAALQRRAQQRFLVSAGLQDQYADRLRRSLKRAGARGRQSAFMDAVAAAIGVPSATVVLLGGRRTEAAFAASDATARAAHDLEFVLGEGPASAAAAGGQAIEAAGAAVGDRWPQYGPAVARLGVQAVLAVPLQAPAAQGAVCAYVSQPAISEQAAHAAAEIADALSLTLSLAAPGDRAAADWAAVLPWFGEPDFAAVIHQAAGMVSAQCGCGIDDALAMLRARAFSASRPAEDVAADVLRGDLRLC